MPLQTWCLLCRPDIRFNTTATLPATTTTTFPSTILTSTVPGDDECDCDYTSGASGGCFITKPARSGKACKCSYVAPLVFTCKGSVVNCKDSNDNKCKQPDTSFQACQQGSGDCEGYDEFSCDCDYTKGGDEGCKVSRAARPGKACKCKYVAPLSYTCSGETVDCKAPTNEKCVNPDTSYSSCVLGLGDCEGYDDYFDCDCEYEYKNGFMGIPKASGCKIKKAPPRGYKCDCSYMGAYTCSGSNEKCPIPDNCWNPNSSRNFCTGDCAGY